MPIPPYDFHIHTEYLKCANETMKIPAIIRECARLGVTALAITDHINRPDQLELHLPIKTDILALDTPIEIYFGAELNFSTPFSDFVFSPEIKEKYGFQFAIGGVHNCYTDTFNLAKIIEIQHQHHLKTCQDPLVDVLVHPYWFNRNEFIDRGWPWLDALPAIPRNLVRELGQVAKETHTAIEINACANLVNPDYRPDYADAYREFLALLAEEGASFSLGSDAHKISQLAAVARAWEVAAQLQLPADRIWRPTGQAMNYKKQI